MPSRKRVGRLRDIALVKVGLLVGQAIVELVRRCDPQEFQRNIAFLKNNVCSCVPAAMQDDFAVNVLKSIADVAKSAQLTEYFLFEFMEYPIMTIIDQLSDVQPYPGVSEQLMSLVYLNLHKLKILRSLEINNCHASYTRSEKILSAFGEPISWLKKCDLRFIETLVCPVACFDETTFLVPDNYSRLRILRVYTERKYREMAKKVLDALGHLTELREVTIHRSSGAFDTHVSSTALEDLFMKNRHLEKLDLCCKLQVFTRRRSVYTSLRHLHVRCNYMHRDDLLKVAKRFPYLRSLNLFAAREIDLSVLIAFPHLSSLCIFTHVAPLPDLWNSLNHIGHNLITLALPEQPLSRYHLYYIYENCKNCEVLDIMFQPFDTVDPLIVPPFPRLKRLDLEIREAMTNDYHIEDFIYPLDFIKMPSLEYLRYSVFVIPHRRLKTILLDSDNFPYLKEIVAHFFVHQDFKSLELLIKKNNLDVTLIHH